MSGLVLKLSPHERVLINGVVVENGDRRGRIRILTENAAILRLKDAFHPEKLDTPVKHICYTIQLALSGDLSESVVQEKALEGIKRLGRVFNDTKSCELLKLSEAHVLNHKFYLALKTLRGLLPAEEKILTSS